MRTKGYRELLAKGNKYQLIIMNASNLFLCAFDFRRRIFDRTTNVLGEREAIEDPIRKRTT